MEQRLQKLIAQAGLASRRGAEDLIAAGAVTVNGQIAQLGQKADPERDEIHVKGQRLPKPEPRQYFVVHKPRGVLSTVKDEPLHDRPLITELVNSDVRLYPVGRLDLNSEGLVLLTNDGELTNQITHPRYGHKKTYKVLIEGQIDEHKLNSWRSGIKLPDGFHTAPCSVRVLSQTRRTTWLRVVMGEGHKRQIRTIAEVLGHPVERLIRTHIGPLELGDLRPGKSRRLTRDEVEDLKKSLNKQQTQRKQKAIRKRKRRDGNR